MSDVPPAVPPSMPPSMPPSVDPKSAVSGPATFLMVVGIVGILVQILGILKNLFFAGAGAMQGQDGMLSVLSGGIGIVLNILAMITGVIVLLGAMKMKNLQSYGFAMAAAVIALIPCVGPCCILGIPAGIWALVILMKPEVKAAFAAGGKGGFPTV